MLLVFLYLLHGILAQTRQYEVTEDYDRLIIPPNNYSGPFLIQMSLNLRNILELDEVAQVLSISVSLNLFWYDTRLKVNRDLLHGRDAKGSYLTLSPDAVNNIWTPDLFIEHLKEMRGPGDNAFFVDPVSVR